MGNDAKKIAEQITTKKMFMITPVFHTRMRAT